MWNAIDCYLRAVEFVQQIYFISFSKNFKITFKNIYKYTNRL